MHQLAVRLIPAVAEVGQGRPLELRPGEMHQKLVAGIATAAGDAGGIEIRRATAVTDQALTQTGASFELVMHVAEHHQIGNAVASDAIDGQGQILIAPVKSWGFPVTTAWTGGIRAETGGAAVGHHHQGLIRRHLSSSCRNALRRFLQRHGAVNGLNGFRQLEPATGTAGSPPHDRQRQGVETKPLPGAVNTIQQSELLAQHTTAAVSSTIVIAQDHRLGMGQGTDPTGQAQIAIAEIADEQNSVGAKLVQQVLILRTPGAVQISCNRETEMRQSRCLGWAPSCPVQTPMSADTALVAAINRLRQERNAVILAHYYQEPEIQDIADFIGDSLELSRKAASTDADVIAFCGVHFMAETAKILSPQKTVVLPDLDAGCSLADDCPADDFAAFRQKHPDHYVVSYINCTAAVKAQSDLICTSSNAVDLVRQLPADRPVLFAPDQNLGRWVQQQSGRELTLWPGRCIVHETFSEEAVLQLKLEHPDAEVIAHPECQENLLDLADFIGSTSKLLNHTQSSAADTFIVLTEPGILHQMKQRVPTKTLIDVPGLDGCSCNACPYMRLNTLQKLHDCLETLEPAVELNEELRQQALRPIERMLELSR